ncbi:MAG: hypothetical protein L3K26_09445 [Candidatus Hydrogenedentes bacterium]|nr:hypothetical protein [Candidatus Hydrogenedentota bacterium]
MRHIQNISSSRTTPATANLTVLGARSLLTLLTEIANFAGLVKGITPETSAAEVAEGGHDE